MLLSLDHRRVGDATVVTCRGRLTAGAETAALQQCLEELIPRTRHLVLPLGGVEFIDSCGLGLLVRYLSRAQRSSGTPSVCALKAAGYRVLTANNLPDALILLIATQPKVVVVGAELDAARGTRTAEEFHRLAAARAVVLPQGFSGREAGEAADVVLRAVGALC